MRTLLLVPAVGLAAALLADPPAASQDPSAATDLLARDLRDWTRLGDGPNPWRLTADRTLACAAATDGFTPDREFADGTLRFEYRFRSVEGKTSYKASLSVRRQLGGTGCRVALGHGCGTVTASSQGGSDRPLEVESKPALELAREPGSWNLVKVQLKGRSVRVFINGRAGGSFDRCDTTRGLIVFEADGSEIEFRHITWRGDS